MKKNKTKKYLLIFLSIFLSIFFALTSSAEVFKSVDKTPEGFEGLYNQKKVNYVEVFIGRMNLGLYRSRFNNNEIEILDYKLLLKKILLKYKIKEIKKIDLENKLNQLFKSNTDLICFNLNNCNRESKDAVHVVFNPYDLRLDLFLTLDYFKEDITFDQRDKYLPSSTSKDISILQNVKLNYSDRLGDNQNLEYNISSRASVSHQNSRLNLDWSLSDGNVNVSNLNYNRDLSGKEFKFGYIHSNSGNNLFIQNQKFFGLHYGVSFNTRKDLSSVFIQPLTINVKRESFVKIYKDDILVYSNSYSMGIHKLKIDSLPYGSYKLKVVKVDISKNEDIEYINYTKSALILPTNDYIWSFDIGKEIGPFNNTDVLPYISNSTFFKASLNKGLTNNFSLYTEILAGSNDNYSFSPSVLYVHSDFIFKSTYIRNNIGQDGYLFDLNYKDDNKNLYVRYNKNDYMLSLDSKKTESYDLGYNHNFNEYGNININYNFRSDSSSRNISALYSRNIFSDHSGNLNLIISYNRYNDESNYGLKINYSFKNNAYSYRANAQIKNKKSKSYGLSVSTESVNEKSKSRYRLGYQGGNGSQSAILSNQYTNENIGASNSSILYTKNRNNEDARYYGSLRFNNTYSGGNFSIGGGNNNRSGVIINNKKNNNKFDISIRGNRTTTVNSNSSIFIPLNSYKSHYIHIQPSEDSLFVRSMGKIKNVTLYPGNVQSINIKSKTYKILFSRFYYNGVILSQKEIKTDMGSYFTDSSGFSELEISSDTVKINDLSCYIPSFNSTDDIIFIDRVNCVDDVKKELYHGNIKIDYSVINDSSYYDNIMNKISNELDMYILEM